MKALLFWLGGFLSTIVIFVTFAIGTIVGYGLIGQPDPKVTPFNGANHEPKHNY